jgi:hypothetical protein
VRLVATSPTGQEVFNGEVGEPAASVRGAAVSFDVTPGRLRLRVEVAGDGPVALDTESRELVVPDLTSPEVRLATPRVFVARSGREYQQLKTDPHALPTALREFRRTDRLLVRVGAFGAPTGPLSPSARLLNRQGQKMADLPVAAAAASAEPIHVDLPLSSLAVGEYLLEVSVASEGQPPATELVAFRVAG